MATAFAMPPTEGSGPEPFRCGTCYIAFRAGDLQRAHMKGEWHRYNLKRRLADLDPIPAAVFADRISTSQAGTAIEATRAAYQGNCTVCQKTFSSPNSYQHHISSQKHKARAAKAGERERESARKHAPVDDAKSVVSSTFSLGEPTIKAADAKADEFDIVINRLKEQKIAEAPDAEAEAEEDAAADAMEDVDEDVEEEAPKKSNEPPHSILSCLFCNAASASVAANVAHMERDHGMFIPEKKYLVDLEGLLTYLEDQVRTHHECIYCGKPRSNVFAAQTHMRDKSHCMIPYMTVEEQVLIGDYYDFRSSYSDDEGDEEGDWEDEDGADVDMQDESWETDDDASSLDSADLTAVPADNRITQFNRLDKNPHHRSTDPRPHRQRDGWHSRAHKPPRAIYYDEHELHLPSGRAVGHRSGRRYYEQNLRHLTTPEEKLRWIRLAIDAGEIDADTGASHMSNALIASGRAGAVKSTRPEARNLRGLANISTQAARDLKKAEKRSQRRREVHSYMFKFQKPSRLGI